MIIVFPGKLFITVFIHQSLLSVVDILSSLAPINYSNHGFDLYTTSLSIVLTSINLNNDPFGTGKYCIIALALSRALASQLPWSVFTVSFFFNSLNAVNGLAPTHVEAHIHGFL